MQFEVQGCLWGKSTEWGRPSTDWGSEAVVTLMKFERRWHKLNRKHWEEATASGSVLIQKKKEKKSRASSWNSSCYPLYSWTLTKAAFIGLSSSEIRSGSKHWDTLKDSSTSLKDRTISSEGHHPVWCSVSAADKQPYRCQTYIFEFAHMGSDRKSVIISTKTTQSKPVAPDSNKSFLLCAL